MAALPYMQLFVAEYLADTTHLTAAQHGAYLLLLMNYWQRGKALKNSNERLANVARMSSEEWNANREVLAEFFEVTDEEWIHHRVNRDLESVSLKSGKASAAGRASAEARANRRSTFVAQTLPPSTNEPPTKTQPLRTEQIRTEQPPISPEMVSRAVLTELAISSRELILSLDDVCQAEMAKGRDATELRDALITAHRDYQEAKAGNRLEYSKGAAKFFGEGDWRDKATWPWKEGMRPQPKRVYVA